MSRGRTTHCTGHSPRARFTRPRIRAAEFERSGRNVVQQKNLVSRILRSKDQVQRDIRSAQLALQ